MRPAGFVGREGSPVLDRYPPKDPSLAPRGPPGVPAQLPLARAVASAAAVPARPVSATTPPAAPVQGLPPPGLIALESLFDVDEFSQLLGETTIRVTVPRESLAEVLRRISEFMGFGIYIYSFRVEPAPSELLRQFVVELKRVDFSPEKKAWVPFQDRGVSDSPFGPSGTR